jgi:hypothetical protein
MLALNTYADSATIPIGADHLPPELLTEVAREVKESSGSVEAFIATCRAFYTASVSVHFSTLEVQTPKGVAKFSAFFSSRPDLTRHIQSLSIDASREQTGRGYPLQCNRRSLDVGWWESIPPLPGCRLFKVRQATWRVSVTMQDILALVEKCPRLQHLWLRHCVAVTLNQLVSETHQVHAAAEKVADRCSRSFTSLTLDNFAPPDVEPSQVTTVQSEVYGTLMQTVRDLTVIDDGQISYGTLWPNVLDMLPERKYEQIRRLAIYGDNRPSMLTERDLSVLFPGMTQCEWPSKVGARELIAASRRFECLARLTIRVSPYDSDVNLAWPTALRTLLESNKVLAIKAVQAYQGRRKDPRGMHRCILNQFRSSSPVLGLLRLEANKHGICLEELVIKELA